ncbi:MAG: AI-2E family transporter, partial [Novosphingobium sp.]|nr:AI-2E family transporter [Novosphingobium sp.]
AEAAPPTARNPAPHRHLLWLIAAAAAFWLMREAYPVLMPLVAALLLALAIWPLVAAIRDRVPEKLGWLGALVGTIAVLAILGAFFAGIAFAARSLYDLARDVGPRLSERLSDLPFALPDFLTGGFDPQDKALELSGDLATGALTVLNMTATTLGGIVLVLFLMLLMLSEAANWKAKLKAIAATRADMRLWVDIGQSAGEKFRAFFIARLILGIVNGLFYGGFLFAFGVEYALLWGLLSVLLSFIPTVGSIIAGVLPTIFVFVTRDFGDALIVAAGLLVIEQVLGNLVDPQLMGRRLAISPLVVLLSLLLWTLLWGLAGAFLAVPLTVLATVVMAHFEGTKAAALLLTECEDFAALDEYSRAG